MKEIMNEWRVFLREESLNEVTAIGAAIGLGRKGTFKALRVGNKGLGYLTETVLEKIPQLTGILNYLKKAVVKSGISLDTFIEGIDKIFGFLLGAAGEKALGTKKVGDLILRFFFFLKNNIPWLFKALPQLIEGVPLIKIAFDTKEIYDQIQIIIEETKRASTEASISQDKWVSSLQNVKELNTLAEKNYLEAVQKFNQSPVSLKNDFLIIMQKDGYARDHYPDAFKLINSYLPFRN